jgi:ATP-binding cassette subfamily F protein 3
VDGEVDDLLNDISFDINKQDRVGLIGPNGCDKPTLLRMILGEVTPASGEIVRSDMVDTAGYLRQYTPPSSQLSVLEAALVGMPEIADLYPRITRLEATMEDPNYEAFDEAVNEYGNTLDAYHRAGGYESEQVAGEILMGLGFDGDDLEQPLTQLSSSQRTRVELARLLVQPTDFLMLDEPTNHLDIEGQNWLEDYLNRYDGTVLIVAHDRHFLDRTVARILELRRGQLRLYTGNYTNYAAARKQEEERAWAQYERAGKEVHRLRGAAGERKRMARKVQGNKATAGTSADFFYARKASKVMKRAKAIGRKVEQQLEQQKTAKPFVENRIPRSPSIEVNALRLLDVTAPAKQR